MLPIINEKHYTTILEDALIDIAQWRKSMIHYIKEENPEINSAIVEIANKTDLDPKAVATGAYIIYKIMELASNEIENADIEND